MARIPGKVVQITIEQDNENNYACAWALTDTGKIYTKCLKQNANEWEEESLEIKEG